MKNNYVLFIFFLFIFQFGTAQHVERKVLKGRIVADSIEVENLTVFNITSATGDYRLWGLSQETLRCADEILTGRKGWF